MTRLTEEMIMARAKHRDVGTLKILNMWGNELDNVYILRKLHNVEVLALSVNRISSLKDFVCCSKLQELYLRKNKIADLSELEYLQCLPELRNLWLEDNPCVDSCGENYRAKVLRYLPKLEKLDNKEITLAERDLAAKLDDPELKHEEQLVAAAAAIAAQSGGNPSTAPGTPTNVPSTPHSDAAAAAAAEEPSTGRMQQVATARSEMPPGYGSEMSLNKQHSESRQTLASIDMPPQATPHGSYTKLPEIQQLVSDPVAARTRSTCETLSLCSRRDMPEALTSCQSTPVLRIDKYTTERSNTSALNRLKESQNVVDAIDSPYQIQIDTTRSNWSEKPDYARTVRKTRDVPVQTDDYGLMRKEQHGGVGCGDGGGGGGAGGGGGGGSGNGASGDHHRPYTLNHEFCYFRQRATDRNAKVLAATLCLIKELDYNSLSVVEQLVRCRLDELSIEC